MTFYRFLLSCVLEDIMYNKNIRDFPDLEVFMIIKNARIALLKRMILPVALLIVCFLFLPKDVIAQLQEQVSPLPIEEEADLADLAAKGTGAVRMSPQTLYYSGCDYTVNGKIKGHFYYSLTNNFCRFYLLKGEEETLPAQTLEQVTIQGHIRDTGELYDDLVAMVARQLEWTSDGLSDLSDPYMISDIDYWDVRQLAFLAVLALCAAAASLDLLITFIYLVFPQWTSTFRKLRRYGNVSSIVSRAEMELKHTCQMRADGGYLYVTPGYFVSMRYPRVMVVPLERVVWIYTHGQLRRTWGRKRMICTIHMMMEDGHTYECGGQRREDADRVLEVAAGEHPEMLIGYSEENKHLAKERIKKR